MSELDDKMFNFNQEKPVSDVDLADVSRLAGEMKELEQEIFSMETALQAVKEKYDRIRLGDLPASMDRVGMEKFTMKDGRKITVRAVIRCNIKEENITEAYGWLRENGAEPLIKNEIKTTFGKGEDAMAAAVAKTLKEMNVAFAQKETVPWNTLSAWAKEQLADGKTLPVDLLGLYVGREAIVK